MSNANASAIPTTFAIVAVFCTSFARRMPNRLTTEKQRMQAIGRIFDSNAVSDAIFET